MLFRSHVFNFELPNVAEQYVHRIGRTARAGADGIAISFVAPDEKAYLRDIEKLTGIKLMPLPLPEGFREAAAKLPAPAAQRREDANPRHGHGHGGGNSQRHGEPRGDGAPPRRFHPRGPKRPVGVKVHTRRAG